MVQKDSGKNQEAVSGADNCPHHLPLLLGSIALYYLLTCTRRVTIPSEVST
jgi:hypothetical protein